MAGGMSRGRGPTLAERSAAGTAGADSELAALQDRPRPVLTGTAGSPGCRSARAAGPGCFAEWRHDRDAGGWQGRVVYAVDDGRATVMVEAWVHAHHLQPAGD